MPDVQRRDDDHGAPDVVLRRCHGRHHRPVVHVVHHGRLRCLVKVLILALPRPLGFEIRPCIRERVAWDGVSIGGCLCISNHSFTGTYKGRIWASRIWTV